MHAAHLRCPWLVRSQRAQPAAIGVEGELRNQLAIEEGEVSERRGRAEAALTALSLTEAQCNAAQLTLNDEREASSGGSGTHYSE